MFKVKDLWFMKVIHVDPGAEGAPLKGHKNGDQMLNLERLKSLLQIAFSPKAFSLSCTLLNSGFNNLRRQALARFKSAQ